MALDAGDKCQSASRAPALLQLLLPGPWNGPQYVSKAQPGSICAGQLVRVAWTGWEVTATPLPHMGSHRARRAVESRIPCEISLGNSELTFYYFVF